MQKYLKNDPDLIHEIGLLYHLHLAQKADAKNNKNAPAVWKIVVESLNLNDMSEEQLASGKINIPLARQEAIVQDCHKVYMNMKTISTEKKKRSGPKTNLSPDQNVEILNIVKQRLLTGELDRNFLDDSLSPAYLKQIVKLVDLNYEQHIREKKMYSQFYLRNLKKNIIAALSKEDGNVPDVSAVPDVAAVSGDGNQSTVVSNENEVLIAAALNLNTETSYGELKNELSEGEESCAKRRKLPEADREASSSHESETIGNCCIC